MSSSTSAATPTHKSANDRDNTDDIAGDGESDRDGGLLDDTEDGNLSCADFAAPLTTVFDRFRAWYGRAVASLGRLARIG